VRLSVAKVASRVKSLRIETSVTVIG